MMDEGIDLIRGLWEGRRVFQGQHYTMDLEARADLNDVAQPVQDRIPIWVVGVWNRSRSMRRVLRCDGILPAPSDYRRPLTTDEIRELKQWLADNGARPDIDIISEGETTSEGGYEQVAAMADAGATWWLETRWELSGDRAERMRRVAQRLEQGPPRVS
jgi:hypothetical protein